MATTYTPLPTEEKDAKESKTAVDVAPPSSSSSSSSSTDEVKAVTLSWEYITLMLATEEAMNRTSWGAIPRDDKERQRLIGDTAPGTKIVLNDVSGFCLPGTFTAILGSSGAGKTTLLNILSQRNKEFQNGQVYLNGKTGKALGSMLHYTAFVEQTDMFFNKLTVQEHLETQARLRCPASDTDEQRAAKVKHVMEQLSLKPNSIIGANGAGISGGERRRLTFASELLTQPLLLFLDEPTSGLDSTMALDVLTKLSELAKVGRTIVCTVHQPDTQILALFDNIIIMAEGRVAFFGTRDDLMTYIHTPLNQPMAEGEDNIANHFIRLISISKTRDLSQVQSLLAQYQVSDQKKKMDKLQEDKCGPLKKKVEQEAERLRLTGNEPVQDHDVVHRSTWCTQFQTLSRRAWISLKRDSGYLSGRLTQQLVVNAVLGLVAFRMGNTQAHINNKIGALFFIMWNTTFSSVWSVSLLFPLEMPLFIREYKAGLYRADTFFLARNIVELPAQIAFPLIYGSLSYWMCGFNDNGDAYLKYVFSLCFAANAAASLGYIISCIGGVRSTPDITPLILFPFLICGGLILSTASIPSVFRWLVDISLFHDAFELMCISIFKGYTIGCATGETCVYTTGESLLTSLGFSSSHLFLILMRMLGYFVIFRLVAFGLLVLRGRAKNAKA